ncbi:MAG: SDR family NAD(P)-dependent oxidoreductase [Halieaceae bacterium]|nr:SDR family NAD(P)-dependent oxidoreductase [Halieaceae bacterium]
MSPPVAIVTGAGKGLGRAYALKLASLGINVVVNNRSHQDQPNTADAVVAEIKGLGGSAVAEYSSAQDPDSGANLLNKALDTWGRLDVVVANAGFDYPQSFHKQSFTDFEAIMNTNFTGTARLLHAVWPHLRSTGYGRVVVSSSTAGLYGNHGQSAYAASKAALIGLMRSLHHEVRNHDICINAIAPYALTPLTAKWFPENWASLFSAEQVAESLALLVSGDNRLSGKVYISGAGKLREARMQETGGAELTSTCAVLAELAGLDALDTPDSASQEFEHFLL